MNHEIAHVSVVRSTKYHINIIYCAWFYIAILSEVPPSGSLYVEARSEMAEIYLLKNNTRLYAKCFCDQADALDTLVSIDLCIKYSSDPACCSRPPITRLVHTFDSLHASNGYCVCRPCSLSLPNDIARSTSR